MPEYAVCPCCGSRLEVVGTLTNHFVPCDAVRARDRVAGLCQEIAMLDRFHHGRWVYVEAAQVELALRRWLGGPPPTSAEE